MSLLNKATIITTPTAHSNGKLHSIKGGSVADFDVVRGSAATRVNAEGLIEDISIIGGELVTNGDFSNGSTGWTLQTGWSIADNKAVFSNTANGDIRTSSPMFTANSKYKINLTVSDLTSGSAVFAIGSGSSSNLVDYDTYINGNYSFEVTAPTGQELRIYATTSSSSSFSIDNVSIKEIIDATNIPRIDYTTGEGVILTEPQSTNLIAYSEEFSNAYWTKSGASVISGFSSPSADAPLGAFKLVEDTSTGNHKMTRQGLTGSGSENTHYFFAKAAGRNWIRISNDNMGNSNAYFDLQNGVIGTNGTSVGAEMEALSDGWYKCSVSYTATTTNSYPVIYLADADNSHSYLGDGTSGVYIYGAQVEALSYATSYIPTSGAIATRLADVVTGAGDSTTFNSTEGVLYFEAAALSNDADLKLLEINDGGTTDRVFVYYRNGTIRASVVVGGATQCSFNVAENVTEFHKVAFKFAENDFALWIDGVEVATDTIGIVFSAGTLNNLQLSNSTNGIPFFAKTKTIAVFSEALTDEELTCLTTI